MSILEAIILGIVQGLAEFLPVSSSGHLVLLQKIFGIEEGVVIFDVVLHLGTLIPVFIVFWKDIAAILKKPFSRITALLAVALVPTALIAFLLGDFFEEAFLSGKILGFCFILTGLILWWSESVKSKQKNAKTASFIDAAIVGTAQGIAILPGISRSGSTVSASLLRGFSREFALTFSFLISIPTILGAALKSGYDAVKDGQAMNIEWLPTVIGTAVAAVCGYFAIKLMKKILKKGSLKVFSYYVFALGALILIDQLFFGVVFERLF
ncbi:MAG: undecaprenyl-diphosphate phosphatase [Eubacteriales bacterium]|nr:undecaprenyl-diphosphate phosphatase [Eubacteriales bacterium]